LGEVPVVARLGVVLVRTAVAEGAVTLEEVLADRPIGADAVAELAPQEVVECEVVKRGVWLGGRVRLRAVGLFLKLSTALGGGRHSGNGGQEMSLGFDTVWRYNNIRWMFVVWRRL
jgi:hypothetical protein